MLTVAVVIPALDEEQALPAVLEALRARPGDGAPPGRWAAGEGWQVDEVVVADNGSRDRTAEVARALGAHVVSEPRRGYGRACLAALAALRGRSGGPPRVVAFLDADGSSDPSELGALLAPLAAGRADLVIGSRALGGAEPGALTTPQRAGNRLAAFLLRALFGVRATDLGPFRAIRWAALEGLAMRDQDYGWTVEMQARAARAGLVTAEVPACWRRRAGGRSKVSGTLRGVTGAAWKILSTIAQVRLGG